MYYTRFIIIINTLLLYDAPTPLLLFLYFHTITHSKCIFSISFLFIFLWYKSTDKKTQKRKRKKEMLLPFSHLALLYSVSSSFFVLLPLLFHTHISRQTCYLFGVEPTIIPLLCDSHESNHKNLRENNKKIPIH